MCFFEDNVRKLSRCLKVFEIKQYRYTKFLSLICHYIIRQNKSKLVFFG